MGKNDIEDALKRLDRLTHQEAQMTSVQLLKTTNDIDLEVRGVADQIEVAIDGAQYIFNQSSKIVQLLTRLVGMEARGVIRQTAIEIDEVKCSWCPNRIHTGNTGSIIFTGNQLRQDLRRWLSPQDPSTNHNIACNAHHKGTATWFFGGQTYTEWRSTSSESLLWIDGKRVLLSHSAI